MLAELAPWGRRSGILAWQGALEGALGCLVTSSHGSPLPALTGTFCFFKQTSRFPPPPVPALARARARRRSFPGCGASRVRP